jgi:hypothetical protein
MPDIFSIDMDTLQSGCKKDLQNFVQKISLQAVFNAKDAKEILCALCDTLCVLCVNEFGRRSLMRVTPMKRSDWGIE